MEHKACAIVTRDIDERVQVLLFRHPTAGVQIVKGGRIGCETPIQTAKRELYEESGLEASSGAFLFQQDQPEIGQTWAIIKCNVIETRDKWIWQTHDDFGHAFRFFWHDLSTGAPEEMDEIFSRVYAALPDYI